MGPSAGLGLSLETCAARFTGGFSGAPLDAPVVQSCADVIRRDFPFLDKRGKGMPVFVLAQYGRLVGHEAVSRLTALVRRPSPCGAHAAPAGSLGPSSWVSSWLSSWRAGARLSVTVGASMLNKCISFRAVFGARPTAATPHG